MVGAKLRLDAIGCLGIIIDSHDTSIVDQNVNFRDSLVDLGGCLADVSEGVEVKGDELGIRLGAYFLNFGDNGSDFGFGTAGEKEDGGVAVGESKAGLFAQPADAGASDEDLQNSLMGGFGLDIGCLLVFPSTSLAKVWMTLTPVVECENVGVDISRVHRIDWLFIFEFDEEAFSFSCFQST